MISWLRPKVLILYHLIHRTKLRLMTFRYIAIQSDVILGFKEDLLANRLALQVFPNPVRQQANIQFNLPGTTAVQITIYDQLTAVVEQLDLGIRSPGEHLWQWERSSQKDGLYYIRLQTAMGTETFKMILY